MAVASLLRDRRRCRSRNCLPRCVWHKRRLLLQAPREAVTPKAGARCHRCSCSRSRSRAPSARRPASCRRLLGCRAPRGHQVSPPSRRRPRSRGLGRHSTSTQRCKHRRLETKRNHRDEIRIEQLQPQCGPMNKCRFLEPADSFQQEEDKLHKIAFILVTPDCASGRSAINCSPTSGNLQP